MNHNPLHWRSLLFVPAHNHKLVHSAVKRGADAIILDLEDSVLPADKEQARGLLSESISIVRAAEIDVVIRINGQLTDMIKDLAAADLSAVASILVPKCDDGFRVRAAAELLGEIHPHDARSPSIIALIESPMGIINLKEIATSSPRLKALLLGSEDYCAGLGAPPTEEVLTSAAIQVAVVAAAYDLLALGLVGSLADYSNLDRFAARVKASRAIGMKGAAVIHPSQVALTNEGFSNSDGEIQAARKIVETFEIAKREGKGAISIEGKMVDEPVYQRALKVLVAQ